MSATMIGRPDASEYLAFYETYVSLVPDGDIIELLGRQLDETLAFLATITEEKANSSYAPDKWTLKEVLGHVIDAERIFAYRALRFARNDQNNLTGFEQDDYVANASFNQISLKDLASEFEHVRRSNILLFKHLDPDAWLRRGLANNNEVSVRALAYMIAGHEVHHMGVIRSQYL
jgi:uncharacterized damage-inducible protein DinB